jgi:hypothetical protein
MAYKYVYIDDVTDGKEEGIKNGIQQYGTIEVLFKQPQNWNSSIEEIKTLLQDYDGLILDLRLQDNPNSEGEYAKYRGSTVAQELRTLIKEKEITNDFPIVLLSATGDVLSSLDQTSYDLFDLCVSKNTLGADAEHSYDNFIQKLISLALGYKQLNGAEKEIKSILGIDQSILDSRFNDKFCSLLDQPTHIISKFILKEIIQKPSFLINENYLSSRLGVDKSSEDWITLLKVLDTFKYKGVFSDYYSRWIMPLLENWWETTISEDIDLRTATAEKRVELLASKLNLKLRPLKKTEKSKSTSFWTVCKGTNQAIDTLDGLIIANQDDNFPWQEKEYISIDEALKRSNKSAWKDVSSLEKNRLTNLKQIYENETTRSRE